MEGAVPPTDRAIREYQHHRVLRSEPRGASEGGTRGWAHKSKESRAFRRREVCLPAAAEPRGA